MGGRGREGREGGQGGQFLDPDLKYFDQFLIKQSSLVAKSIIDSKEASFITRPWPVICFIVTVVLSCYRNELLSNFNFVN